MKHYTFAGQAACVTQRRSRRSGTIVSIYAAAQANLDTSDGAWVTVCEDHHTRRKNPADEQCYNVAEKERA